MTPGQEGAPGDLDTMAAQVGGLEMRFRTTILQGDKTATGIRVPAEMSRPSARASARL